MNPNARRQIKDIQFRAEQLINGKPSIADIEEFDQYNEEFKRYLINHLTEPELVDRAKQIPKVLEVSNNQMAAKGIASVIAIFAPGLVTFFASYFQERNRIENAIDAIREARGGYATIEFFTRNIG
jgi:hypothetical protein